MVKIGYAFVNDLSIDNLDFSDFCEERKNYVNSIGDEKRKKQSYCVWMLLLKMIKEEDIDVNSLKFLRLDYGKWVCLNLSIMFSLSHSDNVVAVSLAYKDLNAIDVQKCLPSCVTVINKLSNTQAFSTKNMSDIIEATRLFTIKEIKIKGSFNSFNSTYLKDKDGNDFVLSYAFENDDEIPQIKEYILD